jgi:integrase
MTFSNWAAQCKQPEDDARHVRLNLEPFLGRKLLALALEKSRKRTLSEERYAALLAACPAWLRRACVMAWETSLSRSDLLAQSWSEVDLKKEIIELKAAA